MALPMALLIGLPIGLPMGLPTGLPIGLPIVFPIAWTPQNEQIRIKSGGIPGIRGTEESRKEEISAIDK